MFPFRATALILALLAAFPSTAAALQQHYDPESKTMFVTVEAGDADSDLDTGIYAGLVQPQAWPSGVVRPCLKCNWENGAKSIDYTFERPVTFDISFLKSLAPEPGEIKIRINAFSEQAQNKLAVTMATGTLKNLSTLPVTLIAHENGIDINGDGDTDITFTTPVIGGFYLRTGNGNDHIDLSNFTPKTVMPFATDEFYNNTIDTSGGNDIVKGTPSTDWIQTGRASDHAWGAGGKDKIEGGRGIDWIYGEGGDDGLTGDSDSTSGDDSADYIFGGPGNDSMGGFDGSDWYYGNSGNDYLLGSTKSRVNDVVHEYGGTGNDKISMPYRGHGIIYGGSGKDYLYQGVRNWRNLRIDCGPGRDTTIVRYRHRKHCEHVLKPNVRLPMTSLLLPSSLRALRRCVRARVGQLPGVPWADRCGRSHTSHRAPSSPCRLRSCAGST
jgi:hypothetical protein